MALRGAGGLWWAAVADITAEVENMQQLIGNLGRVKRTVAPNTRATVLLMPSQAFMKRTLEAHPLITNDVLIREVEKAADVYARYYIQDTLQDPAPDGEQWSLESALGCFESSTSSRPYLSGGAPVTCSSATARSVSRQRHACIAYWPVWCVMQPSVCLQLVWE